MFTIFSPQFFNPDNPENGHKDTKQTRLTNVQPKFIVRCLGGKNVLPKINKAFLSSAFRLIINL
jgi:hypothetical protein